MKRKNREKRREIGLKIGDWEFGIIGMYQKQKIDGVKNWILTKRKKLKSVIQ